MGVACSLETLDVSTCSSVEKKVERSGRRGGLGGRWGRIWGRCVPLGWSVSGALDVGRVWVPSYDAMMELERIEMFVGDNS